MHPATRTQVDGAQEMYSELAALYCNEPENTDRARQEFKEESDVNNILKRFGVNAPQRQVTFGETDFNIDLQQAFQAITEAKAAHTTLPPELKKDYPTWQSLLNAIERGEVRIKPEAEKPKPDAKPAVSTT